MDNTLHEDAAQAEADDLLGVAKPKAVPKEVTSGIEELYKPRNMIEQRALELLGNSNLNPSVVANALGVTPARISQLLAIEEFSQEVTRRRFINLRANSSRDDRWDGLEDKLLDRLEKLLPSMFKANDVLKALQVANQAKRRGVTDPNAGAIAQTVVPLQLPASIINNYQVKVDVHNNVVQAGDQSLVTATLKGVAEMASKLKPKLEQSQESTMAELRAIGYDDQRSSQAISELARSKPEADFRGQEISEDSI